MSRRQSLEHMLARYPDDTLRVWREKKRMAALILPSSDRDRIVFSERAEADFHIFRGVYHRLGLPDDVPLFHSVQAYGSAIGYTIAPNSDAYRGHYRAAYADVVANGTLIAREAFDIYIHNGELRYLRASCEPPAEDAADWVFLHIIPDDPADLPADRGELGFENYDFNLSTQAAFWDGKCIYSQALPDYPIARIRTGQNVEGESVWRTDIDLAAHAAATALYESIAAGDYGQPVARSGFDVYMRDGAMAYLKENCAAGDVDARFFLHIVPVDPADLPADWRERGFENLDFGFAEYGAYVGDDCVAARELPGYGIELVRTGQFVGGEGRVWGVEFAVGR